MQHVVQSAANCACFSSWSWLRVWVSPVCFGQRDTLHGSEEPVHSGIVRGNGLTVDWSSFWFWEILEHFWGFSGLISDKKTPNYPRKRPLEPWKLLWNLLPSWRCCWWCRPRFPQCSGQWVHSADTGGWSLEMSGCSQQQMIITSQDDEELTHIINGS